jgi:hypothetical protein
LDESAPKDAAAAAAPAADGEAMETDAAAAPAAAPAAAEETEEASEVKQRFALVGPCVWEQICEAVRCSAAFV